MDYMYEPPWCARAAVDVDDRFLPHVEPDRPGRVVRDRSFPLRRCWYWGWVGRSFRTSSWHHRNFCLLQDFEETLLCGLTNSKYGETSNLKVVVVQFQTVFNLSKVWSSFKLLHIFTRKHVHACNQTDHKALEKCKEGVLVPTFKDVSFQGESSEIHAWRRKNFFFRSLGF